MSVRLFRIAVFDHPLRARLARNYLEAEGIPAFIGNTEIAQMNWTLTNAIGGIEVKVEESQAAKARAVLESLETTGGEDLAALGDEDDEFDGESDIAPPRKASEIADNEELPTEREENARRAMQGAVLGLILLPLQLYVAWLLFEVFASDQRLNPRAKRQAILAAVINVPLMLLAVLGCLLILGAALTAGSR